MNFPNSSDIYIVLGLSDGKTYFEHPEVQRPYFFLLSRYESFWLKPVFFVCDFFPIQIVLLIKVSLLCPHDDDYYITAVTGRIRIQW